MSIYDQVKEAVPMKRLIEHLSLRGKYQKNKPWQFRSACPACKPDGLNELSIDTRANIFTCYAEAKGIHGDVIGLYAHLQQIGQRESAEALVNLFRLESGSATTRGTVPNKRTKARHKPTESIGRTRPQLIVNNQLKPANDDEPEEEAPPEQDPTDYTDLL